MKGIQFQILFAIILLVLALIVYFVWGGNISNMLSGIKWSDKVLQSHVDNQEKELQSLYDSYKANDGGLDAYESSILLAKAIEFTWTDCYNLCKDERELFTGFFLNNPIDFSKGLDCGNYPISSGDKVYPKIFYIKDSCSVTDLGVDKTKKVDEWVVTSWGLANTTMCGNYKLGSNEGNKQWGNTPCKGDDEVKSGKKCADFCDTGGWGADKIDWQAGIMQKGNKYGNIRIIYSPGGWLSKPEIIVKEISAGFDFSLALSPASGSVVKGSSITSTVSTTLASGTSESVSFSCSGLPSGASCSFSPPSLKPAASSALTISALSTTPAGTYSVSVIGTASSAKSASYSLTVT